MDQKRSSTRLADAMTRARRQWQTQSKRDAMVDRNPVRPVTHFTIALSREAGANGSLVARAVGERLGWFVYDHELVEQVAADMGVRVNLLDSLDEKHRSWMLECMEAFQAAPAITGTAYHRHLLETLLSLAAHGECVIVGRGAAQVLPPATTLRVRLISRMEDRTNTVAKKYGVPPADARRRIEQTDRERTRFVTEHFQKDPTDTLSYDLVLNTSRFSVSECAELIVEALHRLQTRQETDMAGACAGAGGAVNT